VLVLIPLLFILPNFWGLNGIWVSFPIADAVSALVVIYFLVKEWKALDNLQGQEIVSKV
jgi:Na+-driven multidrug efflux pump